MEIKMQEISPGIPAHIAAKMHPMVQAVALECCRHMDAPGVRRGAYARYVAPFSGGVIQALSMGLAKPRHFSIRSTMPVMPG